MNHAWNLFPCFSGRFYEIFYGLRYSGITEPYQPTSIPPNRGCHTHRGPEIQSRRHGEQFVGLGPANKASTPQK